METEANGARITPSFNLALFAVSAAFGIVGFLCSGKASGYPTAGVVASIGLDALRFILAAMIAAYFIKEVWRRLISSLWSVRPLTYQEALAVVLIPSLLWS
jgi:hypothetical protein